MWLWIRVLIIMKLTIEKNNKMRLRRWSILIYVPLMLLEKPQPSLVAIYSVSNPFYIGVIFYAEYWFSRYYLEISGSNHALIQFTVIHGKTLNFDKCCSKSFCFYLLFEVDFISLYSYVFKVIYHIKRSFCCFNLQQSVAEIHYCKN